MWTPGGQRDLLTFAGMRGGGKGYTPPQQSTTPSYTDPVSGKSYRTPEELNAGIAQRQTDETTASTNKTNQAAADKAAAHTTWLGQRDAALSGARTAAMDAFTKAGADPNAYLQSDIEPTLQRYYSQIKEDDPNVQSVFPTDLGNTIVNNVLSGKRTAATNQLNNIFTPTYAQDKLGDSIVNPYVDQLLDEQFNPLAGQLTNAQKRGTLTDQGYQAATAALGSKRTAGADTIRNLGQSILGTERGALNDYITGARNQAANTTLAGTFDPTSYQRQAESMVGSDISGFGGALRNAVGGTKFADLTELLNAGGAAQGINNPTAANPNPMAGGGDQTLGAAIMDDKKRGLGTQGAF